jgi:hypothetical protein
VYIGPAEDRAAKNMSDDADQLQLGPGHSRKLPGFAENSPPSLKKLLESDPSVTEYLSSTIHDAMENGNSEIDKNTERESDRCRSPGVNKRVFLCMMIDLVVIVQQIIYIYSIKLRSTN